MKIIASAVLASLLAGCAATGSSLPGSPTKQADTAYYYGVVSLGSATHVINVIDTGMDDGNYDIMRILLPKGGAQSIQTEIIYGDGPYGEDYYILEIWDDYDELLEDLAFIEGL
ncbi:hypothetical protein KDL44_12845 [bacterium]|nr:hypothetical protein [bacterium]